MTSLRPVTQRNRRECLRGGDRRPGQTGREMTRGCEEWARGITGQARTAPDDGSGGGGARRTPRLLRNSQQSQATGRAFPGDHGGLVVGTSGSA